MEEEKRPNGAVVPDLAASAGIEGGSSLALPASDDGLGRCLLQMMKTPSAGASPASFSATWEEYLRSVEYPRERVMVTREDRTGESERDLTGTGFITTVAYSDQEKSEAAE